MARIHPATCLQPHSRRLFRAVPLFLLFILVPGVAYAVPGEVADLTLDDPDTIDWAFLAGASGYHLYHTTGVRIAAGDYGDCLVGSHRTTSLSGLDDPGPGALRVFLVTAFDESGEGSAGPHPGGGGRTFTTPCVPSRRLFDLAVNGDTGDGVLDGVESARNSSMQMYATPRELIGVYLHSGEVIVSASDFAPARILWKNAKTDKEKAFAAGWLVHFAGDMNAHGMANLHGLAYGISGGAPRGKTLLGGLLRGASLQSPFLPGLSIQDATSNGVTPQGGSFQDDGSWVSGSQALNPSCQSGVAAKCASNFGYRPWRMYKVNSSPPSDQLFTAAVRAARADYGDRGVVHTREGTRIDIDDSWVAGMGGTAVWGKNAGSGIDASGLDNSVWGPHTDNGIWDLFGGGGIWGATSGGGASGRAPGTSEGTIISPAGSRIPDLVDSMDAFDCPTRDMCNAYYEAGLCRLYNLCYDAWQKCMLEAAENGAQFESEIVAMELSSDLARKDCGGWARAREQTISRGVPSSAGLTRFYRSQVIYDGPLGHGWDHAANERLAASDGDIILYDGSGRADLFVRTSPTTFASPPGVYAILIQNPDMSFTLRDPDGTLHDYHRFDGSNLEGAVESVEDRNGNVVSYMYDHQGLLSTVVDTMGRSTRFEYDALGRIIAVTDFDGREVQYGYDGNGDLITVRSPIVTGTPNGNDFPSGKVTTYGYSGGEADDRLNHNLTGIIRPNNELSALPAIQMTYGSAPAGPDFDRLTTQTIGGDDPGGGAVGGTIAYSYEILNAGLPPDPTTPRRGVMVTDRNGNQRELVHNWSGNLVSHTAFTNRDLRPGEPDYTTLNAFNADGELLETILPQGNRLQFTYDGASPNRGSQGNLVEVRAIADNPGIGAGRGDGHGGPIADRIWMFGYEGYFNQLRWSTDPRGNDPAYVPQNGGDQSAARYTATSIYDLQEGDPATNGLLDLEARFGIDGPAALPRDELGLGDVNGDGRINRIGGNPVRVELPAVRLDPLSGQAAIEGDTSQEIMALYEWNDYGQPVATIDAEGNRHEYEYFPETDPNGDGTFLPPPDDGRILDPATGGYLKTVWLDTIAGAGRNNGTDPTPATIRLDYQYDEAGNVTGLVDGRGVLSRFIVNQLDQVVEARMAAATADASGPGGDPPTGWGETGLVSPGFVTRFAYDANDNLTLLETEDRGENRGIGLFIGTAWSYDLLDNLTSRSREATSTKNLVTQFAYDANENLLQVTQPEGNAHEWGWDERDLPLSAIVGAAGPRGGAPAVHQYEYDGNGNLVLQTDPLGKVVDVTYDGFDRPATTIGRIGNTADLFYDPISRVVRAVARGPVGGPTPADRSGATNEDLAETHFLYDELGRLFRRDRMLFVPAGVAPARPPILGEGPLAPGDDRIAPDDGLISTLYEYDRLSRRSFATRDSSATTRHDYDGAGRLLETTLPMNAGSRRFTYDAASNLIETEEIENPSEGMGGPPAETFLTTAFHDALGRLTMVVDNVGQTSRMEYDSLGAVTATTDPRGPAGGPITRRSPAHLTETVDINAHGNVSRFAYDGAGRLLATERVLTASGEGDGTLDPPPDDGNTHNPDGLITTTVTWDDNSLPAIILDDRGNQTIHSYDNLNRQTGTTADDGTATLFTYDAQGNITSITDANGSAFTNGYDNAHRLVMVEVTPSAGIAGTTMQTFEYDGLGRLTRATDNNDPGEVDDDVTTTFLYDSLSRPLEEGQRINDGTSVGVLTISYGWLAESLPTDLTYPDGRHIGRDYDGAERLVTITDLDPTVGEEAAFDYFGLGRVHSRTYGNGVVSTMLDDDGTADIGYDGVRRIILLRHVEPGTGGTEHATFEQRYDRVGNPTSQRRPHHPNGVGSEARTETYGHDSAGRLVAFAEGFAGSDHVLGPPPDDGKDWILDGTGNWAEMSRNGIDYRSTPNNRNQYNEDQSGGTASDDGEPDDFLDDMATTDPDGLNFAYDENGSQRFDGRHTLTYDPFNRMIGAVRLSDGATVAAYTYDALGRRITRVAEVEQRVAESRRYLHAGTVVIEERDPSDGDAVVRQIIHGGVGPLWQRLADGTSHYYLEDPGGSVAALLETAAGGGAVERATYDPYGKPQLESPANVPLTDPSGNFAAASQFGNTLLWRSLWYDPELGARADDVNSDWGGYYCAGGDRMGVEPSPFDPGARMGTVPSPYRLYNPNIGREANGSMSMQSLVLQGKMKQENQLYQVISGIMKNAHDTLKAIIANLR